MNDLEPDAQPVPTDAATDAHPLAQPSAQPPAPSTLQTLRTRLGSINTLTQREVDQVVARLRNKAGRGEHQGENG